MSESKLVSGYLSATRGTLQEFVEWAMTHFDRGIFVVVTEDIKGTRRAMYDAGYKTLAKSDSIRLHTLVVDNEFMFVASENVEFLISGSTITGIYFCDVPTERDYQQGVARCRVDGSEVWITEKTPD